jgi:hypothetical protein
MAITTHSVLELAKQGKAEAIATLINRSIQSKGIIAEANLEGECLKLDLRSPQKINQKAMVSLIRKGMLSLQVKTIKELVIFAYQSDYETASDTQIWQVNLDLESPAEPTPELARSESPSTKIPEKPISESTPVAELSEVSTEIEAPLTLLSPQPDAVTLVHQPVQIKHILQTYQDIIIRFTDPNYGNIKCLCTLTELVQVINSLSFGNANPALKHLLEAIAESTTMEENGDRLINNISVLQPGSQWQKAKIRLVLNIFFEAEGFVPTEPTPEAVITLEALKYTEAIETPASPISEIGSEAISVGIKERTESANNIEAPKTQKQILLEDLSSLLPDLEIPKPSDELPLEASK